MASAIVDPGKPKVHTEKWTFEPRSPVFAGEQPDEVGVYGGGRGTISAGVTLNSWPETGEFRIRIKAAAGARRGQSGKDPRKKQSGGATAMVSTPFNEMYMKAIKGENEEELDLKGHAELMADYFRKYASGKESCLNKEFQKGELEPETVTLGGEQKIIDKEVRAIKECIGNVQGLYK